LRLLGSSQIRKGLVEILFENALNNGQSTFLTVVLENNFYTSEENRIMKSGWLDWKLYYNWLCNLVDYLKRYCKQVNKNYYVLLLVYPLLALG